MRAFLALNMIQVSVTSKECIKFWGVLCTRRIRCFLYSISFYNCAYDTMVYYIVTSRNIFPLQIVSTYYVRKPSSSSTVTTCLINNITLLIFSEGDWIGAYKQMVLPHSFLLNWTHIPFSICSQIKMLDVIFEEYAGEVLTLSVTLCPSFLFYYQFPKHA